MTYWIAVALIAAGSCFALYEAREGFRATRRYRRDPERALALMQSFRLCVVGLAVVGMGSAWMWEVPILFGLSLAIAGEELLESTVMIAALKDWARRPAT